MKQFKRFFIIVFLITLPALAFSSDKLKTADSLFEKKLYVEALDIYNKILENEGITSHQILIKMAFIKEGLGDVTSSLYYLNLYRKYNFDPLVEDKILKLAGEKNLSGYKEKIKTTLFSLLFQNFVYILLVLTAAILIWSVYLSVYYWKNKKISANQSIYYFSFIIASVLFLHYDIFFSQEGIIKDNHSLIMDGPSAGANLIEQINKGHKINILNNKDIWYEIEWNDRIAYIKSKSVWKL